VRIKYEDKWKTTFCTRYAPFECNIMLFEHTFALVIFQYLIKNIVQEDLDDFVIYCLNIILIYLKNANEYKRHVCLVLHKWHAMLDCTEYYTKLKIFILHTY